MSDDGTLKFQIEDTAPEKLTWLKRSINFSARMIEIGFTLSIKPIDI